MSRLSENEEYENHLDKNISKWFAIYTGYKREKIVAKDLTRKGIENYLPLTKVLRQWERKKRTVELPLLNCYVFVKITKSDYIRVLETENVVKFVHFSKNLISIPEKEMEIMKRIVGEGISIETKEISYVEGDKVEIANGNLAGLQGILIQKQGNNNFVIELNKIGYAFQMHIEPSLLIKIETDSPV